MRALSLDGDLQAARCARLPWRNRNEQEVTPVLASERFADCCVALLRRLGLERPAASTTAAPQRPSNIPTSVLKSPAMVRSSVAAARFSGACAASAAS